MEQLAKVGLVGFGAVAETHMEAYQGMESVRIVAVAETSAPRLDLAQERFGVRPYQNVVSMLEQERLDIVCVLTPASAHEQITLECARAHTHVLCEKPLALSLAACERMIAACRENSVYLCYGASYRYLPALIRAREMVLSGELGDILLLREQAIGGSGPANRGTLSFAHYPKGGPGGSGMGLVDHGIHLIDTFTWLMNTRARLACGRGNISGESQGPEHAQIEYENGALGQLVYEDGTYSSDLPHEGIFSWGSGWDINGPVRSGHWSSSPGCIHVHGTRGALRIFYYANKLYLNRSTGISEIQIEHAPMPANFRAQLLALVEAIRSGRPAPVPGEAGAEALGTLLQIYSRKSREGVSDIIYVKTP